MGDHRLSTLEREQQVLIDAQRVRLDEARREIATLRALVLSLSLSAEHTGPVARLAAGQALAPIGVD